MNHPQPSQTPISSIPTGTDAQVPRLPDLDFEFQVDSMFLRDLRSHEVDQSEDVRGGGSFVGHDEVAMPVADFTLADSRSLEASLLNERATLRPLGFLKMQPAD